MKKNRTFTITELLIVLVVIGVLATLAVTQYGSYRERVVDREAFAVLRLMQQAQRIYLMENDAYYPMGGITSETDTTALNNNLRIYLNEESWDYVTYSGGALGAGTSTAARVGGSRTWALGINGTNSTCTGSCL